MFIQCYELASPTLRNVFFWRNQADVGGAAHVQSSGASDVVGPVFEDCVFSENVAFGTIFETHGGAALNLQDCGAAIRQCVFTGNTQGPDQSIGGGAIRSIQSGLQLVSVEDSDFSLNFATFGGAASLTGGIFRFDRCRFRGNQAGVGLAIRSDGTKLAIAQCLFFNNKTIGDPGWAVLAQDQTEAYILNSTFHGNDGAVRFESPNRSLISNSILWNGPTNSLGVDPSDAGALEVHSSCIEGLSGSLYGGFGNIGTNPLFANGPNGDLRLGASSPCVDAGNNLSDFDPFALGFQPLPAADLDGKARIVDGNGDGDDVLDMGAYEFQGF